MPGIVAKQSIKGSIWSYLGVVIGFITTTYLYTQYLTPEVIGLFSLIVAISTLSANVFSLGMNNILLRFFPYFRNEDNGHHGFLFTVYIPMFIGFIIFIVFFFLLKEPLIQSNIEKSALFAEYIYLLIPATFFVQAFIFLDGYNRLLYDSVMGTFLQEFFQRILILISVLLFVFQILSLNQLIIAFTIAVCTKAVVLLIHLIRRKEIFFKINFKAISNEMRKEMFSVTKFSYLAGLGSLIVFQVDKIVVNQMLNLSNTGIYTIAFYFGALVSIPSRPLLNISAPLISDAWARKDKATVTDIYYKSCLNQFVVGGFLFLGVWANIDNIIQLLGDDYLQSKWVIFFIGIGYLFDMLTGANEFVIRFSKYYRVALLFTASLVITNIILLYTLIPMFGIVGAAMSIASSLFLNNTLRFVFLKYKYGMQPFDYRFIVISSFYIVLYFLLKLIPQQSLFIDIFIRGGIITLLTFIFIQQTTIFNDLNKIITGFLDKILKRK